jgi:hypothetical protein
MQNSSTICNTYNSPYINRVMQMIKNLIIPESKTGATSENQWNFGFYSRSNNRD